MVDKTVETDTHTPKFQPHLSVGVCENNAVIADGNGKLWHVDLKAGTVEEVTRATSGKK